jgi:hypothetical protein
VKAAWAENIGRVVAWRVPLLLVAAPQPGSQVCCLSEISQVRAVPSFELAISQAIYHSKWLLGRFLGLMKGIEGQATETAA